MRRLPGLELDGELRLEHEPDQTTRVRFADKRILIDLATLRSTRTLVAPFRRDGARMRLLRSFIARAGLIVEARLGGRTVARMSEESRPSLLLRLIGLPGVELVPAACLAALVRRPR